MIPLQQTRIAQAAAQTVSGPVQNDVTIADADAQLGAYLIGIEFQKFPHHENTCGIGRQMIQARVEDGPELVLVQGGFGIAPITRPCLGMPMGIGLEQGIKCVIEFGLVVRQRTDINRSAANANGIDDLVAKNREDPGFQRRVSGELAFPGQCGRQRFLHDIFRQVFVAQLETGEAKHVVAQGRQVGLVVFEPVGAAIHTTPPASL